MREEGRRNFHKRDCVTELSCVGIELPLESGVPFLTSGATCLVDAKKLKKG